MIPSRMKCYSKIMIPSSKVRRAIDRCDIYSYAGHLILESYKWSLRTFEGDLLATQYYKITSEGKAAKQQGICMGRYKLCQKIILEDTAVYKHEEEDRFLYRRNG